MLVPRKIGDRVRRRLDVADQITDEKARFRFSDPALPTLVFDPGGPGFQYVLAPLRV